MFELSKLSKPDARLLFYLGTTAKMLGKSDAALVAFEAALNLEPSNIDYLQAVAASYEAKNDFVKSYEIMQKVVGMAPDDVNVMANYGVSLERLGRLQEVAEIYSKVLQKDPFQIVANVNYGSVLHKQGRKKEALAHNLLAYERLPEHFGTLYNLVDTLIANFQYKEALRYCELGLTWQPRHAHLMMKKAMLLGALSRYQESLSTCSQARIINPNVVRDLLPWTRKLASTTSVYMDGHIFEYEARFVEQKECYWLNRTSYLKKLQSDIDHDLHKNRALMGPENAFNVLSLGIDAPRRLMLLRNIALSIEENAWLSLNEPFQYIKKPEGRVRVAYLSPDFREHATSILTRQIYHMHDRNVLEVYAYSLFPESVKERYRLEIENSFDVFVEVSHMSSLEIANLIHHDAIDILVDLAGYTTYSRPEVMAMRPAPIQMQYLGFSSTMGADFIDYALIDKQLCPDDKTDEWYEQPIRLPHTLYPYDNEIDCSPTLLRRTDFGLPEDQFVFCCFNNSYKIEPLIFERWMNLLKAVPNSVLWLLGKDTDVQENLESEAEARGVDKSRLIFAGRVPMEQHLPRYQLADLFLDTYWVNAHTTA
ncbi:MAG: hypothetical protein Q8J65_04375, partial [Nitrosomonadales bacterium]|nr:hypothetical protein [Nitrosomonadales bacterium]